MEYKVFTQACPPVAESEKLNLQDLGVLDKTSLTSVVEFMQKFQEDATFTPPTKEVMFDTDKYQISIDEEAEFPNMYEDLEELSIES